MALKSEHIEDAYSQLRISGITVIPSPELQAKALNRLENMMAKFYGRNMCLGYNFEQTPDLSTESGVERKHWNMIATNLAVHLIPDFNKQVPPALNALASADYSTSSSIVAADNVRQVQPPDRMPRGSGNSYKFNHQNRYNYPDEIAPNMCESNVLSKDDIEDYTESFVAYLDSETISSYTIAADTGLTLGANSNTDETVVYRITAAALGYSKVTITITTSTGRIHKRVIHFQVI